MALAFSGATSTDSDGSLTTYRFTFGGVSVQQVLAVKSPGGISGFPFRPAY